MTFFDIEASQIENFERWKEEHDAEVRAEVENAKQIIIDGLLKQIKDLEKQIISRPIELYAIEDCISGNIIFNARGGCYKDIADANDKISRLLKENPNNSYRIVTYKLQ